MEVYEKLYAPSGMLYYYSPIPYAVVPALVPAPLAYYIRDNFCPNCGHTLDWVSHFSQWYCYRCNAYLTSSPVEKKKSLF